MLWGPPISPKSFVFKHLGKLVEKPVFPVDLRPPRVYNRGMDNNDYLDPMDCQVQPEERIQAWEQSPHHAEMSDAEMEAYRKDWEERQRTTREELVEIMEELLKRF